jgi:hypothetical protein
LASDCARGLELLSFPAVPFIDWIDDEQADGELAAIYSQMKAMDPFRLGHVPEVFRAMSQRPDFLKGVLAILPVHFSDGALTYPQKEMIASYVSAVCHCHF